MKTNEFTGVDNYKWIAGRLEAGYSVSAKTTNCYSVTVWINRYIGGLFKMN